MTTAVAPKILIDFFKSNTWHILKRNRIGLKIAHEIVSEIMGHNFLMFVDDNADVLHDPTNMSCKLNDTHKIALSIITSGDDYELKIVDGLLMKKVGSAVVSQPHTNQNTTELVYASTFIPFDSSF